MLMPIHLRLSRVMLPNTGEEPRKRLEQRRSRARLGLRLHRGGELSFHSLPAETKTLCSLQVKNKSGLAALMG